MGYKQQQIYPAIYSVSLSFTQLNFYRPYICMGRSVYTFADTDRVKAQSQCKCILWCI